MISRKLLKHSSHIGNFIALNSVIVLSHVLHMKGEALVVEPSIVMSPLDFLPYPNTSYYGNEKCVYERSEQNGETPVRNREKATAVVPSPSPCLRSEDKDDDCDYGPR